jgi:hypothetical protein
MSVMPERPKTIHDRFAERALLFWTAREVLELGRKVLVLVLLVTLVAHTARAFL